MNKKLSVVIPCYNSEKSIANVVEKDISIFRENQIADFEFVLVNDNSRDGTWTEIERLAGKYPFVTGVNLAKNSGQHGAIMAGFHYVSGENVVVSDDDGQTQMEAIGTMIQQLETGYDVVMTKWGRRGKRSLFRKIGTAINDAVSNILLDNPDRIPLSIFFVARRFIIEEMIRYRNPYPYITGLVIRATHNIGVVEVEQLDRQTGQSGYSMKKLLALWVNGLTAFSIIPLRIASYIGVICAMAGMLYGIYVIIRKLILGSAVAVGWSSSMAIFLFMSGVILFVLGIIGEYVGRIYMCINNAPQYVVRDVINHSEGDHND